MIEENLIETFSGMRGVYGKSINEKLARQYAICYCQLFKKTPLVLLVGGDSRNSTPALKNAMIGAFSDYGVKKIIDIGIVPLQVCEYFIIKFKIPGGVYITASHNEPEYNGWKFLEQNGAILSPQKANALITAVHRYQKSKSQNQNIKSVLLCRRTLKNKIIQKNQVAIDSYISFVLGRVGKESLGKIRKTNFRIILDPNGGASVFVLKQLFRKLSVDVKIINDKIGEFNRIIEPNIESLSSLSQYLIDGKYNFACGFDCDADRVEFVLPPSSSFAKQMGFVLSGNYVFALACDAVLAGTKNQIVVTNDATSYLVREVIRRYKARTKEVEVGEVNIVRAMKKHKSIIGGEGSNGGVIVPPIKCRDGILAVCFILKMLAERRKSLDNVLEAYPRYFSEKAKLLSLPEESKNIQKKLETYFNNAGLRIKKTGGLTGGLKVLIDENSYIWFRQSKTESGVFRIITDGDNQQKVKRMLGDGIKLFNEFKSSSH